MMWDWASQDCNVFLLTVGVVVDQGYGHTFVANRFAAFECPGDGLGTPRFNPGDPVLLCGSVLWKCRETNTHRRTERLYGFKEQHRFGWRHDGKKQATPLFSRWEFCPRMVWECDRLFNREGFDVPLLTPVEDDINTHLQCHMEDGTRAFLTSPRNPREDHRPPGTWSSGCLAFASASKRPSAPSRTVRSLRRQVAHG